MGRIAILYKSVAQNGSNLAFWKKAGRSHRMVLVDLDGEEVEELLVTDKTFHFRWCHPGWTGHGSLGLRTRSRYRSGGRGTGVFLPGVADSDFVPPLTHRLPRIIRGYVAKSMQKHPSDGKTKRRMPPPSSARMESGYVS